MGLLRARQTTSQLLAAAGAGIFAALRSGIVGTIAGWLLVALASMLATLGLQLLRPALGLPSWSGWTSGWNSAITGAGLAVGAALAGAAAVRVVAARSWRPAREVRLAIAIVGATVIGYVALVWSQQSLNWASVIAFMAIPLAFIVGTYVERLTPPGWRLLLVVTTAIVLGALAFGTVGGFASRGPAGGYEWTDQSHGYAMIAPWWQEPGSPDADIISAESGWGSPGVDQVTVDGTSEAAIARFTDYRLEAWLALPPQDGWPLVPGQTKPFATAPATRDGASVSGTIAFNQQPGVEWAQVVLTAIGPDGRRYLLWAGGPEQTEFFGSVASWFAAFTR